jgi:hypothetical protein
MTAITTIRIDHDALPEPLSRKTPEAVAEDIEAALRKASGRDVMRLSGATLDGVRPLMFKVWEAVQARQAAEREAANAAADAAAQAETGWTP